MIDIIDKSIEILAKKVDANIKADDALKYTQAALNLAHVRTNVAANEKEGKE